MSFTNSIKSFEIPNISDIIHSIKSTKNKVDTLNINTVRVHYFYSDNRFKYEAQGIKTNIADIPIVFIEEPEKFAFLVLDDSLIWNVSTNEFEIFVNERFTHSIIISDLKEFDKGILSDFIKEIKLILPINPSQFKLEEIKITNPSLRYNPKLKNTTEEKIKLLPNILSGIGRAKLLQRTAQVNNDGLLIALIIGFLIGAVIFLIIGLKM